MHLDAIRALAAAAVMVGHLRNLFFQDYGSLAHPNLAWSGFYVLTSLGNQSVILFFVLSGLLVSFGAFKDANYKSWSWRSYFIQRFTRLVIVLWPALVLTFAFDTLGRHLFGDSHLYGGDTLGGNIISSSIAPRSTLTVYLGNAFFLQQWLVVPAGTNTALWSLSCEFWYYVLFPLLFLTLKKGSLFSKIGHAAALMGVYYLLPNPLTSNFPVWLLGCAISVAWAFYKRPTRFVIALRVISAVALVGTLAVARANPHQESYQVLVCLAMTAFLYFLIAPAETVSAPPTRYARLARFCSEFSYSLYLTHLPLLCFLRSCLLKDSRWPADLLHVTFAIAIATVAIGYAYFFSVFTEANTNSVRKWLMKRVQPQTLEQERPSLRDAA